MSLYAKVDVTAIQLSKNIILAGVGSYANVYDKNTAIQHQRIHCLRGQKIYGFVISECKSKIIVFGGKQFTALSLTSDNKLNCENTKLTQLFETIQCSDWLHSVIWVDDENIAVQTAHNVVQRWNITQQHLISVYASPNNSILYSGLLLSLQHDILVLAGTVFSEVLIHRYGDDQTMHTLKGHRGVIFSISCKQGMIVTTSDDRSVRIWSVNSRSHMTHNHIDYWKNAEIISTHELYGHLARVMRSCITDEYILSVGEDSALCFWNHDGKLLKKVLGHQNGSVWSVDADNEHVVTGGGDGGIVIYPITVAEYNYGEETIKVSNPKKVAFTARQNIAVLSEDNVLTYHNVHLSKIESIKLNHESTYKSLSLSSCKQLVAIVDMCGNFDVFAENSKDTASLVRIINTKLNIGKILSMHWAGNRHIVFCSDNGKITVLASNNGGTDFYGDFVLPPCKERWLTAATIDYTTRLIILGDRCGNIHIYRKVTKEPIRTFSKVHGRYGPTSITVKDDRIISTGRNGVIKYFHLDENNDVNFMHTKDVDVQWVEKFLDKDETLICGFQERDFVVLDVRSNTKLMEVACGGGHRSWDAIRYFDKINGKFQEVVKFMYLKNSDLHIVNYELSKIMYKNIENGSHPKEINSLITCQPNFENTYTYFISGGEDTTLRISTVNPELKFDDLFIFKQLSNIRALKTMALDKNIILVVSAGGRAQICVRTVEFYQINNKTKVKTKDLVDYMIKGTDKVRRGNKKWTEQIVDFDPETRIMDVEIKQENNYFIVFAGCSDAFLRIFKLILNPLKNELQPIKQLKVHATCLLKTSLVKFEIKHFLVTCSTRGEIAFFDVSDEDRIANITCPIFSMNTNKSGINSFSWHLTLNNNNILIGTGGDDNSVHLVLLKISKEFDTIDIINRWSTDKFHCSQITGLILLKNYLLTTSIDQRITLCKWESCGDVIKVDFLTQNYSDVPDIQGMDLIEERDEFVEVCVFGKGMEILKLPKSIREATD